MHVDDRALSDFLLDSGLIARSHLALLNEQALVQHEPLLVLLQRSGAVDDDHLRRATAHVLGIPFVILSIDDIAPEALVHIPEPLSRTHNVIAFRSSEKGLEVALLDMDVLPELDSLRDSLKVNIIPRLTDHDSIKRGLHVYQKFLKEKFGALLKQGTHMVDALIHHALYSRASGVHIEHSTLGFLIRYRIGKALHEAMQLPEHAGTLLVEQLKSLAKLFPVTSSVQEGKFKVDSDGETHIVHMHSVPTADGEKVMLHLAREKHGQKGFTLSALGFHGKGKQDLYNVLLAREGLLLVAGPASSGKTTLMYTLLDLLDPFAKAIATVEETIEMRLAHVAQTQVKEDMGFSAASALRSVLKQDPDVVMVGDIRDSEVALIAAQAAAQERLVIAGIEASSAADAVGRMLHFGVPPLVLASTLKAAVGLGLVRKLCTEEREDHRLSRPESHLLEEKINVRSVFGALKDEHIIERVSSWKDVSFFRAEPCKKCSGGYSGELGLQEIMPISSPIKELLLRNASVETVEAQAREEGMLTLSEDGLFKAAEGLTSVEEILGYLKEPK